MISETKKQLENYGLSEEEMVIFTTKAAAFKRGRKYHFQIKITDQKTTGQAMNDVKTMLQVLADAKTPGQYKIGRAFSLV